MSMADLIQWGRTAQRTGLLHLSDGQGKEIDVVFRDGRIVFSSTNDQRERWRTYIVYLGLCTENDIDAAFQAGKSTGTSLASVLVYEKKITSEQALATLTEKTIEDVCDVFLWPDGSFKFEPSVPSITSALVINVDPIHIVCEGLRRAEVWTRMTAYIHPESVFEESEGPLEPGVEFENPTVTRNVRTLLDGQLDVRQVIERLPFSRFKIYRAIDELLEHRFIRNCDVTALGDREKRTARTIELARSAADAGRFTDAMETLQGLAASNPGRPDILDELMRVTRAFEHSVYEHNFTKEDVPVVTIGAEAMTRLNIHPVEAFLLSRVDGRLTVRDILHITPVSESEGLRAFKRLLTARVLDFPTRVLPGDKTHAAKVRA